MKRKIFRPFYRKAYQRCVECNRSTAPADGYTVCDGCYDINNVRFYHARSCIVAVTPHKNYCWKCFEKFATSNKHFNCKEPLEIISYWYHKLSVKYAVKQNNKYFYLYYQNFYEIQDDLLMVDCWMKQMLLGHHSYKYISK